MSVEEIKEEMSQLEEKIEALTVDQYASDGDGTEYEVTEADLPKLNTSYDTVVVVIGIPVIPSSKKGQAVQTIAEDIQAVWQYY